MKKLLLILLLSITTSGFTQTYYDTYPYGGTLIESDASDNSLKYTKYKNTIVVQEFDTYGNLLDKIEFYILSSKTTADVVRYTVRTLENDTFDILFFTPTEKIEHLVAYEFEDVYMLIFGDITY
jgi:hypothetical protein